MEGVGDCGEGEDVGGEGLPVVGDVALEEEGERDADDEGDCNEFDVGLGILARLLLPTSRLHTLLAFILRHCLPLFLYLSHNSLS